MAFFTAYAGNLFSVIYRYDPYKIVKKFLDSSDCQLTADDWFAKLGGKQKTLKAIDHIKIRLIKIFQTILEGFKRINAVYLPFHQFIMPLVVFYVSIIVLSIKKLCIVRDIFILYV